MKPSALRRNLPLIVAAVAGLLLVGAFLLLTSAPSGPEGEVRRTVEALISDFESRNEEAFLGNISEPLEYGLNRDVATTTHDTLRGQLARAWNRLSHINVEADSFEVSVSEKRAQCLLKFHWTVSTKEYPNFRFGSKSRNRSKNPETAELAFEKEGQDWRLVSVRIQLERVN